MSRTSVLRDYSTILFDCDGVLLDSNRIKTEAFRIVASEAGEAAASKLVEYHRQNGGVSRNEKFSYFVEELLGLPPDPSQVDRLVARYAGVVRDQLVDCPVASRLTDLRAATAGARWAVVSGGAEAELRDVFTRRGLAPLFDAGIYGSPDSKDAIFAKLRVSGILSGTVVYLGDSRYDHEAASRAGIEFVFVSNWTEFTGWRDYFAPLGVRCVGCLQELLSASFK